MKKLIASVLCALALSTTTGCFTAAGSVVGHEIQESKEKQGEQSSAHAAGTAIGLAMDVALVLLAVTAISSAADSLEPDPNEPPFNPYQPGGD